MNVYVSEFCMAEESVVTIIFICTSFANVTFIYLV